jgi:hypothetical protein
VVIWFALICLCLALGSVNYAEHPDAAAVLGVCIVALVYLDLMARGLV